MCLFHEGATRNGRVRNHAARFVSARLAASLGLSKTGVFQNLSQRRMQEASSLESCSCSTGKENKLASHMSLQQRMCCHLQVKFFRRGETTSTLRANQASKGEVPALMFLRISATQSWKTRRGKSKGHLILSFRLPGKPCCFNQLSQAFKPRALTWQLGCCNKTCKATMASQPGTSPTRFQRWRMDSQHSLQEVVLISQT